MNPIHAGKSFTRLLRGVIIVLAAILVLEMAATWLWGSSGDSAIAGNEQLYGAEPPKLAPAQPQETYQEAIDRSLFSWNRQPKESESPSGPETEISERWQITGVVNTGNATYAIFHEIDGDHRLRLEEGMYLEKWKVESISPEAVKLTSEEEEQVFRLKETQNLAPVHKNGGKKSREEAQKEN